MTSPATLTLRLATQDDVLDILHWRNETLTRSMSRDTTAIRETEHRKWFSKALQDPQRLLLIGVCEKKKIGMVRFDKQNIEQWEVSIVVNPETRGQGFGKQLLKIALNELQTIQMPTSVSAIVNLNNEPSLKLFESLGFIQKNDDGKFTSLTLSQTSNKL